MVSPKFTSPKFEEPSKQESGTSSNKLVSVKLTSVIYGHSLNAPSEIADTFNNSGSVEDEISGELTVPPRLARHSTIFFVPSLKFS